MPLTVKVGEGKARVDLGEEAAEVGETGCQSGHRLLMTGRSLALEVGDEGRPQGCSDVGHAPLVALGSLPVRRRCLDDLEVEQNPVRTAEGRAVVALSFPGHILSGPTRLCQLLEVRQGELVETATALDEQTTDRLGRSTQAWIGV